MSQQIEIVNPLEVEDWDKIVLSFGDYSFFHSQRWANVLVDAYGYKPRYFLLRRDHELRAVMPLFEVGNRIMGRKGVSLPFTDHCCPLAHHVRDVDILFQHIIASGQKSLWRRIEIKGGHQFFPDSPQSTTYHLHHLDLEQDADRLLKRFRSSTRRNIKKAQQRKIDIEIANDIGSMKKFYRLNCITRKHHGVPPQPFHFFRCIHKHVLAQEQGFVILAHHAGRPIAGAIFFHFGRKAMYKYGASRRDHLGVRPNNLVMWEAIRWYGQHGFTNFDMGRSEPDNRGLNQFKNGWGTQIETLKYYTYDIPKMRFRWKEKDMVSATQRIFQKMPIPVLRMVGKLAYRHMG